MELQSTILDDRRLLLAASAEAYSGLTALHTTTTRWRLPRLSRPLGGAARYAVGAVLWIILSDLLVSAIGVENTAVNIAKGLGFVAATTALLWFALRRHERQVASMITDLQRAGRERVEALESVAKSMGAVIETRDPYTAGHQQRVGDLAARLGQALGLDANRVEGLRIGGYLHDVGKVAIPSEVLNFPGALSDVERALVQTHAAHGRDILRDVPFPWPVREMAIQHHERLDGSGYPNGLRGDEICFEARIIAVADVFDAITSARPYREGRTVQFALTELRMGVGTQFDADVVDALVGLLDTQS